MAFEKNIFLFWRIFNNYHGHNPSPIFGYRRIGNLIRILFGDGNGVFLRE